MPPSFPLVEHELLTAACEPANLTDLLALHHRLKRELDAMRADTGTLFGVDEDTLALARGTVSSAWSISLCCPGDSFGFDGPPDRLRAVCRDRPCAPRTRLRARASIPWRVSRLRLGVAPGRKQ